METLAVSTTRGSSESGTGSAVPQPRLVKAAHEFEAQMMKELMAPLARGSSVPGVGEVTGGSNDDDPDSGSGAALKEFATEALGKALSAAGGLGIAKQILGEIGHTNGHIGNHGASSA